ncbi:MAG: putative disulfide bond isomerase [Bacteriovoracaceae bacterium]|nr:putative disulfide bond isomerase [Bacteriovoracaceae bacterium]
MRSDYIHRLTFCWNVIFYFITLSVSAQTPICKTNEIGKDFSPVTLAADPWRTDFEAAKDEASKSGKKLFVLFEGSDWCVWCKKLDTQLSHPSAELKKVLEKFVLVRIDFPQRKKMNPKLAEQNEKLKDKYQITGFPSILLLSPDEKPIGEMGYDEDSDTYSKKITELSESGNIRDQLLREADNHLGFKNEMAFQHLLENVKSLLTDKKSSDAIKLIDEFMSSSGLTVEEKQQCIIIKAFIQANSGDNSAAIATLQIGRKLQGSSKDSEELWAHLNKNFEELILDEGKAACKKNDNQNAIRLADKILSDSSSSIIAQQKATIIKAKAQIQSGKNNSAIETLKARKKSESSELSQMLLKKINEILADAQSKPSD